MFVNSLRLFPTAIRTGFAALKTPTREDFVAAVGEATGLAAAENLRRAMSLSMDGRRVLRERPLISAESLKLKELELLPKHSLGRAYHYFLTTQKVSPDTRTPITLWNDSNSDAELRYVMLRYRQVHDFFHVLTGLDTSLEAEIALKYFEAVQTGLPMPALAALLGPLRLSGSDREILFNKHVPWLIQSASSCKFLMSVYFEELMDRDINQVRKDLGIHLPADFITMEATINDDE